MGFRSGSYATIWSIEPVSDTRTKARISISRKKDGQYETDFSGYVDFIGTAAAKKASLLREKDRIRLKDVDVTNNYVAEKNTTYYNCKIFSFETQDEMNNSNSNQYNNSYNPEPKMSVDEGEIDDSRLPF